MTTRDQQPRRQSTHHDHPSTHFEISSFWVRPARARLFRDEPVTDATNSLDQARLATALELLPDPRYVHLERVRFRARRHRPDRLRQLLVRDELAAAAHQGGQNPEFDSGP